MAGSASLLAASVLTLQTAQVAMGPPGDGQLELSAYVGKASTADGDLRLRRSPDTDVVLRDVAWGDESLRLPIYYGIRVTWWLPSLAGWGAGIEFTHAKMVADDGQLVEVSGVRDGAPVRGRQRIGDYLDEFEITHGHNFLTLHVVHRWRLGPPGPPGRARLEPYLGAGAGLALPHAEARFADGTTGSGQVARPALRGFAGVDAGLWGPLSAFLEYELAWADVGVDLGDAARIETRAWTHQLALGAAVRLGADRAAGSGGI